MRKISVLILGVLAAVAFTQCKSSKETTKDKNESISLSQAAHPKLVVYKTKANYYKNVPVMLSEDKSKIVSYPDPKDLMKDGEYRYPVKLEDGYLLDRKGINEHVAFINLTYEQYSKMSGALTASKLYETILDKDPLEEMYRCGRPAEYSDPVAAFNKMIRMDNLDKCERVK